MYGIMVIFSKRKEICDELGQYLVKAFWYNAMAGH